MTSTATGRGSCARWKASMLALAVASAVFSSGEMLRAASSSLCLRQFEAFGREALDAAGDAAQRLVAAGAHLVQNGCHAAVDLGVVAGDAGRQRRPRVARGIVVNSDRFHIVRCFLSDHVFERQHQNAFGADGFEPFDALPEPAPCRSRRAASTTPLAPAAGSSGCAFRGAGRWLRRPFRREGSSARISCRGFRGSIGSGRRAARSGCVCRRRATGRR